MPGDWNAGMRARIIGRINGERTVNVLHFGYADVWNVDNIPVNIDLLKQLANAIHDCILTTLIPVMSNGWTYEFTEVQVIAPNTMDPVTNDAPAPVVGTGGPQGVNQAVLLTSLRSGIGGRNGRGRNFWPPAGEAVATAGEWDAGTLVLMAAFCACMAGKFIGPGKSTPFTLGIFSRTLFAGIFANFATAFHAAATFGPQTNISNMSTRKKGRGV